MTAGGVAAACVDLLGVVDGPVEVVAPAAKAIAQALRTRLGASKDAPAGAVVVFVGEAGDRGAREGLLHALHARLHVGAPVVLADHNQPRGALSRIANALALLAGGRAPSRARYPAARELQACGFAVEALRLGARERVQFVRARRA